MPLNPSQRDWPGRIVWLVGASSGIGRATAELLHGRGARVVVSVVNPGFVRTPLTSKNEFAMPALITPAQAAREIVSGWEAGRFEIHFPKRFTLWMKALSHLGDAAYFAAIRRTTGL